MDEIASFRLGLIRIQQPVEWHIQNGGQMSNTVAFLPAINLKPVQLPNFKWLDQFSKGSVFFYF